jgi:NUMOD4 motif/HNH endonuclease
MKWLRFFDLYFFQIMTVEKWVSIPGYERYYQVSDAGNIRSLSRFIKAKDGRNRRIRGRVLKFKVNHCGYLTVCLCRGGKKEYPYIHRLVAEAFIPNPNNLPQVNHITGNKTDNAMSNLEWVTHQQNVQHAYAIGLSNNQGGNHTYAVGVVDNTLEQHFDTIKDWCSARGINYNTGRNILSGSNTSKTIDLTEIVLIKKVTNNE